MAQVTYANLFSESRANVLSLISNKTSVPDPRTSSSEFRKWIYSSDPSAKSSEFEDYPCIVLNHADVDIEAERGKGSVDGKSKNVFWDIEIEIITSDRGYGDVAGKGAEDMDTISNNVMKTLLDSTNRTTLSNNSMKFSMPTTTAVNSETLKHEKVFRRSIMLSFSSRIQVSG